MESTLKTLFLKQSLDLLGPRTSFQYEDNIESFLLENFQGKVSLYELLLYFKADFIVIPPKTTSPWLESLKAKPDYVKTMMESTTNVINIEQIDFGKYDIVITHDPILGPWIEDLKKHFPNTLFCYILAEHSSWQMHQMGFAYDIYLDHTLQSGEEVVRLPQALNMLFPRVPKYLRNTFNNKKEKIFLDYRTIGHFITNGNNNVAMTMDQVNNFYNNNQFDLPTQPLSETSLKPFMFGGNENDGYNYYGKLSESKYFVSIANRVGQAAFDAASIGSLVIGTDKSDLHKRLCHPDALMTGEFTVDDLKKKINEFEIDKDKFDNAWNHQEKFLSLYCVDKPINNLKKACKIKTS